MNHEVTCRYCNSAFVVDDAFAGTTLPCPSCGSPDGLVKPLPAPPRPAPQPVPQPARRPASAETATRAAPTPQVRTVAPPQRAQPAAAAAGMAIAPAEEAEVVVCPRCKLHFVPRRAAGTSDNDSRPVVLVVEDMDYFRQVAAEVLSSRFEVRQASTVAEARAQLAQRIDLLVLDLSLDGGNHGIDLLRTLRGKPFPILIYTDQDASAMDGSAWDGLQRLGADDVVMKGMNAGDAILRKVCGLLGLPWDEDR